MSNTAVSLELWAEEVQNEEIIEKHYSNGCWGADGGFC
jgi:hypothetical protein